MNIFFDESGQTGCVLPNKKGALYGRNQRFFVLAGIVCKDDRDELILRSKYKSFLNKYGVEAREFKGTELMKPENRLMLEDFMQSMLDDEHIFICCYDKIFYLASMISMYFLGREMMQNFPVIYFTQQSALTRENQIIFKEFCKAVNAGTAQARYDFVKYITNYSYEKIDESNNLYLMAATKMLKDYKNIEDIPEFPLPKGKGAYLNDNITNLINLNALGEAVLALKVKNNCLYGDMKICHDHIEEFETEFIDTMRNIKLEFKDSKDELLLQYADNVASIFRRIFSETIEVFEKHEQWDNEKQYYPRLFSKVMNSITENNIKFVTTISDWVLSIAVKIQFNEKSPTTSYNDMDFMRLFYSIREKILDNISLLDYTIN